MLDAELLEGPADLGSSTRTSSRPARARRSSSDLIASMMWRRRCAGSSPCHVGRSSSEQSAGNPPKQVGIERRDAAAQLVGDLRLRVASGSR